MAEEYKHLLGNFVRFPGKKPVVAYVREINGRTARVLIPEPKLVSSELKISAGSKPVVLSPRELNENSKKILFRERVELNDSKLEELSKKLAENKESLFPWVKKNIGFSSEDKQMWEQINTLTPNTILKALKKAKEKKLVDNYWEIKP